jgi:phosphatidylglycerophosphate synthase
VEAITLPTRRVGDSLRRLRSAQKSSQGAPLYSLYVNRPAGRVLAAIAYRLDLRPNQVTAISACCTLAALVVLVAAQPTVIIGILVTCLLCLGYALDSADGQLARLRGGGSVAGEWLDHVVDSAKASGLHLAVLVAFYRNFDLDGWQLLVPIGFAFVSAVYFFGMILNEQLARVRRMQAGLGAKLPTSSSPRWVSIIKLPNDYGLLCLIFLVFGLHSVFFGVYGLFALANAGYLLLILPKWFKDMRKLDQLAVRPEA